MAAPAFGSSGTWTSTAGTTLSLAVPASVASDDVLVVEIFIDGSTVTVTGPTGFAHAENSPRTVNAGGGGNHSVNVLWKRASASDTGTYDFTLSAAGYAEGQAHRYTGCVASGNPWDSPTAAGDGGATNSTTTPAVSVNTGGPDRLLFFAGTNWSGGSWTPPSGFTERTDATSDVTADDKVQAVQGSSGTVQATCSGNDKVGSWLGALVGTTASSTDLGGRIASGFHPGRGPTQARFYQPVRYDTLATTQITADTGLAVAGLAAASTTKKVAVVTATAVVGLAAAGTAKKVSADTGTGALGLVANAIHVPITADTGLSELGLAATGTVKKVAVVTCAATLGLSSGVTAKKVSKDTGTAPVGLAATDTAKKVSKDTGIVAVGLSANAVRVPITADTGVATVGLAAQVANKKVLVASAVASVGLGGAGASRKVAKATQVAALGVCGTDTVRKIAKPAATVYAGLVARFAGIDLRAVTGRAYLGLRAQTHQCVTYHSFTGSTARPNTGTTVHPDTGTTASPC